MNRDIPKSVGRTVSFVLDAFPEGLQPIARANADWGECRLTMSAFLHGDFPPDEAISSVRAVLIRDGEVAVVHNPGGQSPLPGGRRDVGESILETLHRELMEETGCIIDEPRLLGFIHFRHLTPCPEGYRYPYPDFFQVVYAARVLEVRDVAEADDWEERVEFVPHEELASRPFDPTHAAFLAPAMEAFGIGAS